MLEGNHYLAATAFRRMLGLTPYFVKSAALESDSYRDLLLDYAVSPYNHRYDNALLARGEPPHHRQGGYCDSIYQSLVPLTL